METAYHYTTYSCWQAIQKEGIKPYPLGKPQLGYNAHGIWLWPVMLQGDAHLGSLIWQLHSKGETRVVLLRCGYDPDTVIGKPDDWRIKHNGKIGTWEFHDEVPCLVVTETIPPERVELVAEYDLLRLVGGLRTTWEDPDPNEHYTRPCSRCGKLACIGLFYTQGEETDICWRCAGRYPVGCDCEAFAREDAAGEVMWPS